MQPVLQSALAPEVGHDATEPAARFEQVFRANARSILGYALRRVDRPEDAADVLSEVMLIAWRRLGDLPDGEGTRLWLYGVARRVIANQTRARNRQVRLGARLRDDLSRLVLPEDDVAARDETRGSVRAALSQLAAADREVLLLSSWEGLEPREIALVLDLSAASARTRLHRARQRLRERLEASGFRPADVPSAGIQPREES